MKYVTILPMCTLSKDGARCHFLRADCMVIAQIGRLRHEYIRQFSKTIAGQSPLNNIAPIFEFLRQKVAEKQKIVLITLIAVTGASTRNPGAHMAVAEDGSSTGSFSGGCVEAAVVAEALDVIGGNQAREVRFGAGSPYLDIRLPCGGGIDLLFTPISELSVVSDIFDRIGRREPLTLVIDRQGADIRCEAGTECRELVKRDGSQIFVHHIPAAKICILGHGPSVESLVRLSGSYGIDCAVLSPDAGIIDTVTGEGAAAGLLKTAEPTPLLDPDPWTACIFYFHDHDWEAALMKQALASPAFYIGAMGSRKTHARRLQYLADIGVSAEESERMIAPIGLIPSTRDPATLALSTLAQVVERYHQCFGARQ
ncbi:XdhC family protein [Sphingorhabdus sp. 109]|jgi:xanthine dehydrogenase accessory factor|uniref:XdhC family protein n=1 Tax=Sphingorhabdus sp. 109 TaxID=2653173 RepID=UPI0012F0D949|nr:XdhC family protein [Sphingorhabdus sp. 109]VWX56165.1 XdhC Rossmann domain protein [Sphingorhabdus sp. 109]